VPAGNARILVIDDEEFVRNVLAAMLTNQGFQVINAGSAEEALQLLDHYQFDLVFTDLAMPRVDGIAAATEIKARRPQTRVVLMSGYGADRTRARAAESDCIDAVISKPFRMDEIQRAIRDLLKS
jgi:CheY-like chemotaxis protein